MSGQCVQGTAPPLPNWAIIEAPIEVRQDASVGDGVRAPSGPVITAAFYAKPTLHFAAVRHESEHSFCLETSRCASFTFNERLPSETLQLFSKITRYLKLTGTKEVLLRSGVLRGTYVQHAFAFKAEAVLDLALGMHLHHVDNSQVARWCLKQELMLPEPEKLEFSAAWRQGQFKAIEAAVFTCTQGKRVGDFAGSEQ